MGPGLSCLSPSGSIDRECLVLYLPLGDVEMIVQFRQSLGIMGSV